MRRARLAALARLGERELVASAAVIDRAAQRRSDPAGAEARGRLVARLRDLVEAGRPDPDELAALGGLVEQELGDLRAELAAAQQDLVALSIQLELLRRECRLAQLVAEALAGGGARDGEALATVLGRAQELASHVAVVEQSRLALEAAARLDSELAAGLQAAAASMVAAVRATKGGPRR